MLKVAGTAVALTLLSVSAFAQTNMPAASLQTALPADSVTVTNWYKQNVYDPNESKIGEIMDVLVNKSGQITSVIVGVGGFLGAGEKDVAVPMNAIHATTKNEKPYLVMNSTKDALKNAPGFKYDKNTTTWAPDVK
jgi:sporulation protein YlmC with PRC-barrel domain